MYIEKSSMLPLFQEIISAIANQHLKRTAYICIYLNLACTSLSPCSMMNIDTRIACCLQCGKSCDDEIQVQRHLDQLCTKCHHQPTAFVDPVDLLEYVQCDPHSHTPRTQRWAFQRRADCDVLHSDLESPRSSSIQQDVTVTDYYQGAAKVIDQAGTKSLDAFHEDSFAEICNSDNLYYPFANHPE